MAVNTITLTGWKEFEAKALDMGKILDDEMDEAAMLAAKTWELGAKRDAPKDFGRLAQRISSYKATHWEVASPVFYSPYMEWGTGSSAIIPQDLITYASQWWTHKIHKGIRPHPYFFVQKPIVEKQLLGDLEQMINTPR